MHKKVLVGEKLHYTGPVEWLPIAAVALVGFLFFSPLCLHGVYPLVRLALASCWTGYPAVETTMPAWARKTKPFDPMCALPDPRWQIKQPYRQQYRRQICILIA